MANTLPLPSLTFRALPTRHINSTRATDAVAKLRYAQHQADEESRRLIAKLRDDAEAESKASTHRCIHNPALPPTIFERGDKPTAFQIAMFLILVVGFAVVAAMSIHDGVMAQHPQLLDAGTMATTTTEWRDGEVVK